MAQSLLYALSLFGDCIHENSFPDVNPYTQCKMCGDFPEKHVFSYVVSRNKPVHRKGLFLNLIDRVLHTTLKSSLRIADREKRQVCVVRKPEQFSATVLVFCNAFEAQTLTLYA